MDALNIPVNAILPFDPRKGHLAFGSVQYIAWEVIIAKIFRRALGLSKRSFYDLIQVHAASMAFLGGAQGFVAPVSEQLDQSFMKNLQDGAKGIPAVFLGQYVVDTFRRGFHVPGRGWTMSDVFASAASKAISRPIFGLLYPYAKEAGITTPLEAVNSMQILQAQKSTLARAGSEID